MTIAFSNQKGGVGKTTSTINLGIALAQLGHQVLLIDFDPQANLTSGLGNHEVSHSIYDAISFSENINSCIVETNRENLFLVPADNSLSGAEIELSQQDKREFFLRQNINDIKKRFDFIFIDCPPSLGLLTINALCAAEGIIIPLQCEYYAMEGIAQLIRNIKKIQKAINPKLTIFGIVLTMYDTRTNLSKEVAQEIVDAFGSHVFQTIIPRNVKIAESPSFGQSIIEYDKDSLGSKSYQKLALEVEQKWKNKQTKK